MSMLGLRKLANLLYGNLLERLKKHESDVYYDYLVVFNAWENSNDPTLGALSRLDIGVKLELMELGKIVHGPTNGLKEYNPSSTQL